MSTPKRPRRRYATPVSSQAPTEHATGTTAPPDGLIVDPRDEE